MDADARRANLQARHDELNRKLTEFAADVELADGLADLARAWIDQVDIARQDAEHGLRVVFLGEVGTGKSTLVAATTGLRLESVERSNPRSWSALPVGGGRTTLGETRIVFETRDTIRLDVEPVSAKDLEVELRLLAQDHIAKSLDEGGAGGQHGEELYDLLRAWIVPDAPEEDGPSGVIEQWADELQDAELLFERFVARVEPARRERPWSRDFDHDDAGRKALRRTLRGLRFGRLGDDAPAPETTTIRLPSGALGPHVVEVVDTQGLDTKPTPDLIEGRTDLQEWLSDPHALLVICSRFESAPDRATLELLTAFAAQDRGACAATPVIIDRRELPDDDPSEKRAHRRERKRRERECDDVLRRTEQIPQIYEAPFAVDARSEGKRLRTHLRTVAARIRAERIDRWSEALASAASVLETLDARRAEFSAASREMDLRLWWAWDAVVAAGSDDEERRPGDGLREIGWAIPRQAGINHHSHVAAAIRRRGRYRYLDFAELGARFAAYEDSVVYVEALKAVRALADDLYGACEDAQLQAHLKLRAQQFGRAVRTFRDRVRAAWIPVLKAYLASDEADVLWRRCHPRWGLGPGYLQDVGRWFTEESARAALAIARTILREGPTPELPARPPLLRIRQIRAKHYRGIADHALNLRGVTALVGDNGHNKTSWLEALAASLGALLPEVGAASAAPLRVGDVHHLIRDLNGVPDLRRQLPLELEVRAELVGRSLTWSRRCEALPAALAVDAVAEREDGPDSESPDPARLDELPLDEAPSNDGRVRIRRLADRLADADAVQLPVLAYYGTQRLWPVELVAKRARAAVGSRLDGYRACLDPASTHRFVLDWMRRFTIEEWRRKKPVMQLQAIRQAVVDCVEEARSFHYDSAYEELHLTLRDGRVTPFRMLSDGYRNIVAMVADIAWRASVLNPHLGRRAPAMAEGIVLIDEIDLHLHPNWQRRVLDDLRRAFPRLQFVTTTHSPFIIQSLEPGELVNLDPDASADALYADESPEDIAEKVMGVELPQRSRRRQREAKAAEDYYALLERLPDADESELHDLRNKLDELLAPYNDNQAFVALLQRKRLVAEAQRG